VTVSPLSTAAVLLLSAVALDSHAGITADRVDLVELNHFYDEQGRLVFDQLIFYDWFPDDARYQVRAWRLIKSPSQVPQRNLNGPGYHCMWQDGDLLRRVHATTMRETWTQYDPELTEREYLPKERRRDLAPGRPIKSYAR
jgi:hypothetical protein